MGCYLLNELDVFWNTNTFSQSNNIISIQSTFRAYIRIVENTALVGYAFLIIISNRIGICNNLLADCVNCMCTVPGDKLITLSMCGKSAIQRSMRFRS